MANTAALLGNLLNVNADINYYTQQSIYWNKMYEANSAKLEKQINYEEKFVDAYDDAVSFMQENESGKTKKAGTVTINGMDGSYNAADADEYAHAKVNKYNEELSIQLADLDIEYDTMKTMYDTMLEKLRADQEGCKTATSTAAQDTGLLQS